PMKHKRPFHFVASCLRATVPAITSIAKINAQLAPLGQPTFLWGMPDGYPDAVDYWVGNIVPRWAFARHLASLADGEVIVDVASFMEGSTTEATIGLIDQRLFAGEMNGRLRASLTMYLERGPYDADRVRETLALAMSGNSFQWY
ncbi:MAG: DUF1800 family protein, partial [bacterium]